jgi:hypothetical protein
MKRPHRIDPHKNTVTDGPIPIAMLPAPQALRRYVRAKLAMVPIWTAMATASPANPMLGNAETTSAATGCRPYLPERSGRIPCNPLVIIRNEPAQDMRNLAKMDR